MLLITALLASPVWAESVVLGLSKDNVAINVDFNGSDILIFGAVKRDDQPAKPQSPLEVIVAVSGPTEAVTVRRKDRRYGIWVNTASAHISEAPSFYAVASTNPLDQILSETEDLRHHISVPSAIRNVGNAGKAHDTQSFADALIRIRKSSGQYQLLEGEVGLQEETLFRTSLSLPANLTEGDYATRVFLMRDKQVVSQFETTIDVRKVGLERWLFSLSREKPLIYGLMSLAIAIAAGWGASSFFRLIRF